MIRITGTLREDQYTFLSISRSGLLRMRNISDKSCTKMKALILCSIMVFFFFLRKSCHLWDRLKKCCTFGQPTEKNGACAFHATYLRLQTHTLSICNTYCFSTATVVARTRFNVVLYVHCMSCFIYLLPTPHRSRKTGRVVKHNVSSCQMSSQAILYQQ